ncbi:MAG: extracellular solute-binding protein [Anaerolineae bacterium]|nr:extracellular solute-binding protein [Anaerolineae bacterium]
MKFTSSLGRMIALLLVAALLAACAPAATEAPVVEAPTEAVAAPTEAPATEVPPTEVPEPVDFTTWFEFDEKNEDPAADGRVGNEYLRNTIPQFNEAFAGKWNWVNQPKAYDKMETELVAAVQAGAEVPDIYEMLSDSVNAFAQNGTVQDLREWAEAQPWFADLDPSALKACTAPDGALLCIPMTQRPQAVYVWTDRYPNGFPKTPEDFLTQAEALKAEGKYAITFYGSTEKGGSGINRAMFTTLSSFGGGLDDGNGNMLLNTPENIAAIEFLREIVAKGYAPEAVFAGKFQEEEYFKDSSAGAFPTGLNGYLYLFPLTAPNGTPYDTNTSQDFLNALEAGDIYLSPFVSVEGVQPGCNTTATGLAIPVGAKNVEAAHDFISWVMTPEQNANYVVGPGGGLPALKTTQSDPRFQSTFYQQASETIGASACRPWYGSLLRPAEAKELVMNTIYKLIKEDPTADIAAELTKTQEEYNQGN